MISPAQFKELLEARKDAYLICAKRDEELSQPASSSIYKELAEEVDFILKAFNEIGGVK
jgi:hypothetical protein